LNTPEEFGLENIDKLIICPTLKHESFSSVLILAEEPSVAEHSFASDILCKPELNNHKDNYKFSNDFLLEKSSQNPWIQHKPDRNQFQNQMHNKRWLVSFWLYFLKLLRGYNEHKIYRLKSCRTRGANLIFSLKNKRVECNTQ